MAYILPIRNGFEFHLTMLNFLGIGAQKAGTTWLFQKLRHNRGISFPAGKEVHFCDE